MANRITESAWVYRMFGQFLHTLCLKKKTLMQTQEMFKPLRFVKIEI